MDVLLVNSSNLRTHRRETGRSKPALLKTWPAPAAFTTEGGLNRVLSHWVLKVADSSGSGLLTWTPRGVTCTASMQPQVDTQSTAFRRSTSKVNLAGTVAVQRRASLRDPRSEEPVATCDVATLSRQCHQSGVTGLGTLSTPSFTHTHACTHTYARAHPDHPEIFVGLCCKKPLCSWRGTPRLRDIQRLGQGIRLVSHRSGNPTPFLLCHRNTSLTRHF